RSRPPSSDCSRHARSCSRPNRRWPRPCRNSSARRRARTRWRSAGTYGAAKCWRWKRAAKRTPQPTWYRPPTSAAAAIEERSMSIDRSGTSSLSSRPAQDTRPAEADRPAERPREAPPKEQVDRFRQLMQHGRQEGRAGLPERPAQEQRPRPAEPDWRAERPREARPKEQVDRCRQLLRPGRREGRAGLPERPAQEQRPGPAGTGHHASAAAAQRADEQAALRGLDGRGQQEGGTEHHGMSANAIDGADLLAMMQAQSALRDASGVAPTAAPPPPTASGRALAEMLERHVRQCAVEGAAGEGDGQVLLRMSDATLPGTDLLLSRTAEGW